VISTYLGAENISLTQPQKDAFRATMSAIGPVGNTSTAEQMHWRSRLDGDAVIMRALFQDSDVTGAGLRSLLATALGIPAAQVASATTTFKYKDIPSVLLTMSVAGVDKMRFIRFAGMSATVTQANVEALAYLKLNAAAWGDS
jgi:hypothetical protein